MDEGFIPQPDYAICPSCKEQVDLPKKASLRFRSKKKEFNCPYCGSPIEYVETSNLARGPPYSME
jgi:transcription initiation factor IIE alpha subunit